MTPVTAISRRYWRMLFTDWADDPFAPARSPEGRSHYNGQKALYLSETAQGCLIASRLYFRPDDPPRAFYPVHVMSDKIIDLRDPKATAYYDVDTTHRQVNWQEIRKTAARSPTWDISDKVRSLGFHGMLYESRSQPDLTHLTLFAWNMPDGAQVEADGPAQPWENSGRSGVTRKNGPSRG